MAFPPILVDSSTSPFSFRRSRCGSRLPYTTHTSPSGRGAKPEACLPRPAILLGAAASLGRVMATGVGEAAEAAAATLFFFLRDLDLVLLLLLADEEQVEDAMEVVDAIVSDSFSLAPRDPDVLGGHLGATHLGGTPPAELAEEAVRALAGGAPFGAGSPAAATVAQVQVPEPLGAAAPPPAVSAGLGAGWAGTVLAPAFFFFFFFFLVPVDAEPAEEAREVVDVIVSDSFPFAPREGDPEGHLGAVHSGIPAPSGASPLDAFRVSVGFSDADRPDGTLAWVSGPDRLAVHAPLAGIAGSGAGWTGVVPLSDHTGAGSGAGSG